MLYGRPRPRISLALFPPFLLLGALTVMIFDQTTGRNLIGIQPSSDSSAWLRLGVGIIAWLWVLDTFLRKLTFRITPEGLWAWRLLGPYSAAWSQVTAWEHRSSRRFGDHYVLKADGRIFRFEPELFHHSGRLLDRIIYHMKRSGKAHLIAGE